MIFAVFVFYPYTQTVCIRICSKHNVCIHFSCQLKSQFKCLCRLRIRIRNSREFAVRQFLLFDYVYVLKTELF